MFKRYAIYYTAQGAFARQGAAWLGWDVDQGQMVSHPKLASLDVASLTQSPRKYGFHATLMAPFRLADGRDEKGLHAAVATLASEMQSAEVEGLKVTALGRFLALTPKGDDTAIKHLAAQVVTDLDKFRAPLCPDDLARRRKSNLSPAHEANLMRWGYTHVMEQFRFHMTLTSRLPRADVARVQHAVETHFDPVLPRPFQVNALTLVAQRADDMFVTLKRYPLALTPTGIAQHSPMHKA